MSTVGWYFLFWLLGIPAGILLKILLIRVILATGWWLIGVLFVGIFVIYGMIPQKIKDVVKGMLVIALVAFCISCFF